jgi:PAS domain S-box-containing protein
VFWNINGTIIEANEALLRMVGYEREELSLGQIRWRDLTAPEFREAAEQALVEALTHGRASPCEKEYVKKDSSRLPVIVGLAMFDAKSEEGVAFVLDLTERRRADLRVRESERRYREVQTELAHANRVATMGELVASIAHEVSSRLYPSRIVVIADETVIASHERLFDRDQVSFDWQHYIRLSNANPVHCVMARHLPIYRSRCCFSSGD